MGAKVHYEDNLFFLHSILRTIESGLKLDVDPEYFKDKILEDLFFIDAALLRTFSSLKDNAYLINRAGYLRSLRRTVRAFIDFLNLLRSGNIGPRDMFRSYQSRMQHTIDTHQRMLEEVDRMLDELDPDDEATDVVSPEEYGYLLSPADDEDGDTQAP